MCVLWLVRSTMQVSACVVSLRTFASLLVMWIVACTRSMRCGAFKDRVF
jgi:hypothetical protein